MAFNKNVTHDGNEEIEQNNDDDHNRSQEEEVTNEDLGRRATCNVIV